MPAGDQQAASADEIIRKAHQSIRRRSQGISPTEVSRSIAIDFEGRGSASGKQPPSPDFLGWRIGDRSPQLHGCVLTKKLNFLANPIRYRYGGVRAANLSACVEELLALAASEQRFLMHFSVHEVEMLQRGLPADLFAATAQHLVDGKRLMEWLVLAEPS